MEADLKRRSRHNEGNVPSHRMEELDSFSRKVVKKYGKLVSSTLVGRSAVSGKQIDMSILVDDINNVVFDQNAAQMRSDLSEMSYSSQIPIKCEVKLASSLWDGFRSRERDTLDFIRGCLVIYDNGFFLPLQDLLVTGKVRPSKESVEVYFVKAERSMKTSNQKVARAVVDLYWAVTDAAHAAVMVAGITPPSPDHLAEAVKTELVARNLVHKRCADVVKNVHDAGKKVMHREFLEISGREFDALLADADFFIKEMDEFVREHVKD